MSVVNWNNAPTWAQYHAMDANGECWWYHEEPIIRREDSYWTPDDVPGLVQQNLITPLNIEWTNSLVCRPGSNKHK